MTVNDQLASVNIQYQHDIEKFKNDELIVMLAYIKILDDEMKNALSKYLGRELLKSDWTAIGKELESIRKNRLEKLKKRLFSDLEKYSLNEQDVQKEYLESIFKKYDLKTDLKETDELWKKIQTRLITHNDGNTYTVETLYKQFDDKSKTNLKGLVNQARMFTWSVSELSDRLFKGVSYTKKNKNNIKSFVPTIIAGTMGITRDLLFKDNKKYIKGYQWISVLDERTSDICLHLSDRYWLYDYPEQSTLPYQMYPPQHYRCRSTTSPIVRSAEELGITEEDFSDKINTDNSYGDWFARQSPTVQRDILGPTRYNMFISGEAELGQLYVNAGQRLTLAQLKAKGLKIPKEFQGYI